MSNSFTLFINRIFRYSFILIVALVLVFIPGDVSAASLDPSYKQLFWRAQNVSTGVTEQSSVEYTPGSWSQFGTNDVAFNLINLGAFWEYQKLNANYHSEITFYINSTSETFNTESVKCSSWSSDISNSSCYIKSTNYNEDTKTWIYVVNYYWTNSSGYIEQTLDFVSSGLFPNSTRFMYEINLFETTTGSGIGNDQNQTIINQNQTIINQNHSIIQNGEQTNEKLDDINDSILDDNTSHSISQFDNFISNFEFKDNGGLSTIVTMPLELIRNILVNDSCVGINLPMFNKNIELPSGCVFWSHFPQSAVVLWHTLFCGLFSYVILTNLFHDIHILKDPHDLGVDTLDL